MEKERVEDKSGRIEKEERIRVEEKGGKTLIFNFCREWPQSFHGTVLYQM